MSRFVSKVILSSGIAGVLHLFRALKYSANGFRACFREEIAFRQECAIAVPHFLAVILLPLTFQARLYLTALWFVLIAFELLNTAIESVTNIASPSKHRLAEKAKDCGSAAVFSIIVLFLLSWFVILAKLVYDMVIAR